ncbi:phospho-N-acetylmuramoyl-pentapeptide-transferase [Candidatus Falkowbacteria bacterium]|nr:phospho-N-acetylmuramoyl-pentapeptide-transferase [Candidatus Falkowbacteria bacterium]
METALVFKIGILTICSFGLALALTPLLLYFLRKYKLGKQIRDAKSAPIFAGLHANKVGTPTMGGIIIWLAVSLLALGIFALDMLTPEVNIFTRLNFLTRSQTLLPFGALLFAAAIGFFDDLLGIKKLGPKGGGLDMKIKILSYSLIAIICATWFYFKLDWDTVHVPFVGNFAIGWWFLPLAFLVIVATAFSVNETDGLDGLVGGSLICAYAAVGAIAFTQGKFDLAAFCGAIIGALVAFLWFNIFPAKFFMGDTGAMSLGIVLALIALYTNTILLLPIIGFIFIIEAISVLIQILSKKIRKKKIFLSTPIHHHFQAIGWLEPKIVMRFWLISGIAAVIGVIIFLVDKGWY